MMLVRIAQGDAYGVACEYIKFPRDQEVYDRALKFENYDRHPVHRLRPGQYTDDTQMSIAVSEVLLKTDVKPHTGIGIDPIKHRFAASFFDCFKRDPREGYSQGFHFILNKSQTVDQMVRSLDPSSDKNGAAMRSVPIGVLDDPNHVKYVANIQAQITHDTIGGVNSSIAVALMSHFALHSNDSLHELPAWLRSKMQKAPAGMFEPWPGGPVEGPEVGVKTARAVLSLLVQGETLLGVARKAIEWGGDTDTVLSIAWGIASTRMKEEPPGFFFDNLEDGPFGRRFLHKLGQELMKKYE